MRNRKNHTLAEHLGKRIKTLRKHKFPTRGSQTQCANAFGVTQSEWSRWENGVKIPSTHNLQRIATFFEVSLDELSGGGASKANSVDLRIAGRSRPLDCTEAGGGGPQKDSLDVTLQDVLVMNLELQHKLNEYVTGNKPSEEGIARAKELFRYMKYSLEDFENRHATGEQIPFSDANSAYPVFQIKLKDLLQSEEGTQPKIVKTLRDFIERLILYVSPFRNPMGIYNYKDLVRGIPLVVKFLRNIFSPIALGMEKEQQFLNNALRSTKDSKGFGFNSPPSELDEDLMITVSVEKVAASNPTALAASDRESEGNPQSSEASPPDSRHSKT